eukprot:scaffold1221_cov237-Pinguiococcus_pyrenoidosus.AAC.3
MHETDRGLCALVVQAEDPAGSAFGGVRICVAPSDAWGGSVSRRWEPRVSGFREPFTGTVLRYLARRCDPVFPPFSSGFVLQNRVFPIVSGALRIAEGVQRLLASCARGSASRLGRPGGGGDASSLGGVREWRRIALGRAQAEHGGDRHEGVVAGLQSQALRAQLRVVLGRDRPGPRRGGAH